MRRFEGGWLEFTRNYPKRNQKYDKIEVDKVKGPFRSFNKWENISNLLLYHDKENKRVTVGIKQHLQLRTEYKITFGKEKKTKRDNNDDEDDRDDDEEDRRQNKNEINVKVSVGKRPVPVFWFTLS